MKDLDINRIFPSQPDASKVANHFHAMRLLKAQFCDNIVSFNTTNSRFNQTNNVKFELLVILVENSWESTIGVPLSVPRKDCAIHK